MTHAIAGAYRVKRIKKPQGFAALRLGFAGHPSAGGALNRF
jgi:hypothetical protein